MPATTLLLGFVLQIAFPDGRTLSDREALSVRALRSAGCDVHALDRERRDAIARAAQRVSGALSDEAVLQLIADKHDWVVETPDGGWTTVAALGDGRIEALAEASRVAIMSYGRGLGAPCGEPFGDDAMNAFTNIGEPVVFFWEPYLDRIAARGESGTRDLARTLAHELTHTLGHTHHDGEAALGSSAYANTVPVYVGCLVERWPDQAAMARCGR